MKIYKIMLDSDADGSINICDAILHEDDLWLVPSWIENPAEQWRQPALMIRLDKDACLKLGDDYAADCLLSYQVPTPVLNGQSQIVEGKHFDVLIRPDIRIPTQTQDLDFH